MSTLLLSIVEAEAESRERLAKISEERGWKAERHDTVAAFADAERESAPHLLLLSVPDGFGAVDGDGDIPRLRAWRERNTQTQIVLLLPPAYEAGDRLALILGARHILHTPCRAEDLSQILAMAAQGIGKRTRRSAIEKRTREKGGFEEIIGVSERMLDVLALARKVAASDTTSIMITGECGTGKGALARAMHVASPRREGPFIEVNCAAIPRNLLESEFFGYEPGAFTDARTEKMGLFECANNGTIFLDEVGEIDYALQAKLLKFLDSRVIRRLSGTRFLPVDVRIVSATNRDLKRSVAERRFREDLFYRLNVVEINIPPLRERLADIRPIAAEYARRFAARMGKGEIKLGEEAFEVLERYAWPGNIRELINAIERAVLLNATGTIEPADFPFSGKAPGTALPIREETDRIVIDMPPGGISLEAAERALVEAAMARAQGNVTRAAGLLRVGRGTLRYKLKKFGIAHAPAKENLQSGSFEPAAVIEDLVSK